MRRTISSTNAWSPGPSKSPYPYIEEPASCGVNNGKGEVVPGGPTKCQSRTKLHQWKLEASRCPGLSRWLDDSSPAPAFDQIAPRTNPKLVLLDKEPETLGNQFQVAIPLFCGCLWGDDLNGVQGVAGSNPAVPTGDKVYSLRALDALREFPCFRESNT